MYRRDQKLMWIVLLVVISLFVSNCSYISGKRKGSQSQKICDNDVQFRTGKDNKFAVFVTDERALSEGYCYLYQRTVNGEFILTHKYPAKFGKNGSHKTCEGDGRTPIGKYHITSKRKNNYLGAFGGYYLGIDYPNRYDKGKTGSGIGIHGGRNCKTNGCLRILDSFNEKGNSTKNIEEFYNLMPIGSRIVIINALNSDFPREIGSILRKE